MKKNKKYAIVFFIYNYHIKTVIYFFLYFLIILYCKLLKNLRINKYMKSNKYSKKTEDKIYELIKKENPTFEIISRKLSIDCNDLKNYINKSSRKYKKNLIKKIIKARKEYFKDAEIKIENALIKKAIGYYSREITKEVKIDKEGNRCETEKIMHKYNPPSERAIIVFSDMIKNRNNKKIKRKELKSQLNENEISIRVGFND